MHVWAEQLNTSASSALSPVSGVEPAGCVYRHCGLGCGLSDYHPRRGRSRSDRQSVSRCILNAFLLVEMTKVIIRSFLSPVASGLRLVPVGDAAAKSLTRYLSVVVSLLGYGQLLVVPIVNQSVNAAAGAGVSALLSVMVLLYLVYIVLRRRKAVTRWLQSEADPVEATAAEGVDPATIAQARRGFIARILHGLAGIWHWVALTYIAVMFHRGDDPAC